MKTFDSSLRSSSFDRLRDLPLEFLPIIQRAQMQELEERIELIHSILHWRTGQAPTVLPLESIASTSSLCGPVLDVVRLICYHL